MRTQLLLARWALLLGLLEFVRRLWARRGALALAAAARRSDRGEEEERRWVVRESRRRGDELFDLMRLAALKHLPTALRVTAEERGLLPPRHAMRRLLGCLQQKEGEGEGAEDGAAGAGEDGERGQSGGVVRLGAGHEQEGAEGDWDGQSTSSRSRGCPYAGSALQGAHRGAPADELRRHPAANWREPGTRERWSGASGARVWWGIRRRQTAERRKGRLICPVTIFRRAMYM